MEKQKLMVCIMGQNCEKFIGMCLESIKDADAIVYCDGGSKDNTLNIVRSMLNLHNAPDLSDNIIENIYNQEDPQMNGKQRNFYLKYLKENYPNYWALCLDADEVVADLSKIKAFIQEAQPGLYSVKMRHFHNDLGHEDATQQEHFVYNRLFKISEAGEYPLGEHVILQPKDINNQFMYRGTTIWHLAHINHCFNIKGRYEKNIKHSNIHNKQFLDEWNTLHMFGKYPNKEVNYIDIPKVILDNFNIDKDYFYFKDRNVEVKHFALTKQWYEYLRFNNVIEFGCGKAPFGIGFNHIGIGYKGIEISKFAVENAYMPVEQGDILNYIDGNKYDLVMAFDVLEHLKYEDIDKAIDTIIKHTDKYILISVPYFGTYNCNADPTHIIKEKEYWWQNKLEEKGLKRIPIPNNWLLQDQIMLYTK